jgi:SulP family sulfate permease
MRFQPVRLQPERVRTERPNAASVQDQVLALADACPDTRALLLDLECTEQLEITSSDMLGMLLDRLHERGIALYMVGCGSPERASTTGVRERLGEDHLWHSISQGVRSSREEHGLNSGTSGRSAPQA